MNEVEALRNTTIWPFPRRRTAQRLLTIRREYSFTAVNSRGRIFSTHLRKVPLRIEELSWYKQKEIARDLVGLGLLTKSAFSKFEMDGDRVRENERASDDLRGAVKRLAEYGVQMTPSQQKHILAKCGKIHVSESD